MKKTLFVLPIILMACATDEEVKARRQRVVKIDSMPAGARVFVGYGPNEGDAEKTRHYLGVTPLNWQTKCTDDGKFEAVDGALVYSIFVPTAIVFFADPAETNLFAKKQVFHGGGIVTPPDKIPEGLFFDLTKP